jgi:hypothetical protein
MLVACVLHASLSYGQTKRLVCGYVYDSGTGNRFAGADVKTQGKTKSTDSHGYFEIEPARGAPIEINHIRFHGRQIEYKDYKGQDTVRVYLTPNTTQVANLLLSEGTETIYEPDFENVLDFAFVRDTLAVLSYIKSKPSVEHRQTIYLQNTLTLLRYGQKFQRLTLPDNVERLHKDPFGRLFVIGSGFILALKADRDAAYLEEIGLDYFRTQVEPLTAYQNKSVFYKIYPGILPEVVHFVLLTELDSVKPIRLIRNQDYFESPKAVYNSLPSRLKSAAGQLADEYQRPVEDFGPLIAANATGRTYYIPENSTFAEGDNVLIYDHMNSWIYRHDIQGNPLDSVRMHYQNFLDEKLRNTIQDRGTGHCYAVHEKGGVFYIRQINHATGGAGKPFKLKYPYAKSIRIYDGWAYYVYRDLSGQEPYKLVREKVPDGISQGI